jgi:putative ABC transport system ATP-binding protein
MGTHQLELRQVTKRYGEQIVLAEIDLDIAAGEFVVVVGRSGSGKSTLLRVLGGLEYPDAGSVLHDGLEITSLDETARARFRRQSLGFVFQFFNLLPTLTAAENIALPLELNGISRGIASARVDALLAELKIRDCGHRFPEELSGGEQQRVAIARAIAHEPALIIADEPTGNLDDATAREVVAVLDAICRRRNTTLVMATHAQEVIGLADRVLAMGSGKLASRTS